MRPVLHPCLSAALIALLLLTSQSAAVARGGGTVAGQMVLCTGAGLVTVLVDETGAPVGTPHVCPDAVLGFLVDLPAPETQPALDRVGHSILQPEARQLAATRPTRRFQARAPPVSA